MVDLNSSVQVGQTTLRVPRLGLGTGPLAEPLGWIGSTPIPEAQAIETVQQALARGIAFFDTAPTYGRGYAEERLGLALAGVPRERYILASKVGKTLNEAREVVYDYSRDGILRSLESSLKRLKLANIDILHIHDADQHYQEALENAYPTLADLRSQGVIKAVGAGMNQWEMLANFARNADFDCFLLAGRYTLLEQGGIELLNLCQARQISVFAAGVFNSGILVTGPVPGAIYNYHEAPPEVIERVRKIEAICKEIGVRLPVAAVQFPLAHPAVAAIILGAQAADEVKANLKSLEEPIPAGLWERLRAAGLLDEHVPVFA